MLLTLKHKRLREDNCRKILLRQPCNGSKELLPLKFKPDCSGNTFCIADTSTTLSVTEKRL